jgi:hypothetical protein
MGMIHKKKLRSSPKILKASKQNNTKTEEMIKKK